MRFLIFFLILSSVAFAAPVTLKSRLQGGAPGDYIVAEMNKNYSFLRIRALTPTRLVLEEINLPEANRDASLAWLKWLEKGAPGHSSWLLYEIDLQTGKLLSCYSASQQSWVSLDEPLFPKMLSLPLSATSDEKRRRIGPAPSAGETDNRALWIPPLVFEGQNIKKPQFSALETHFPDDGSELALCRLELYFLPNFPFPFWIETSNGHYTFKIRTLECGHGSISPVKISSL